MSLDKNTLDISLSYYFDKTDSKALESLIPEFNIRISILEKPKPGTGGLIWQGIVFFLGEYIISKLLDRLVEISKDKMRVLFRIKKKLKSENIEKFTFNIPLPNGMIFMNFTEIKSEADFERAIRSAKDAYDKAILQLDSRGGYYDMTYDVKEKCWRIDANMSFNS